MWSVVARRWRRAGGGDPREEGEKPRERLRPAVDQNAVIS